MEILAVFELWGMFDKHTARIVYTNLLIIVGIGTNIWEQLR